ncbi:phytanoyl-CoA dioxygenase family protein [Streptomyces netropsis]|uniref:Ectoine hydroxylase-related dioxygenase (Phytanoyl-CoA dioxygenase family) n=1 Tax=Streptomyces netropsis TaxID=55404 RepID=A0A7W7LJH2_STRNE|nr:phytanoyl-CoA dioxygenase family protein [Streptomyces netropsis]MBB4890756.1 ectoine hydroxylase-related dioxygenase (phytanoyl-CoA dioxygenase family) [Streptomyces netropsis]GGR51941.1 hypothetical protein GCM10010219_66320 [Streptomyces netropsis]
MRLSGLAQRHPEFLDLVDLPAALSLVTDVLGWNIFVYHSHLDVNTTSSTAGPFQYCWHQDMAGAIGPLAHPRPLLSIKVGYFLTDTSCPDRGNLWLVPGSHRREGLTPPADPAQAVEGAMPVLAPAGSALLLDPRVWHTRGANASSVTRKVLFYAYAYRWLRPRDDLRLTDRQWAELSPVHRQLLGGGDSLEGFYHPQESDVPLRAAPARGRGLCRRWSCWAAPWPRWRGSLWAASSATNR